MTNMKIVYEPNERKRYKVVTYHGEKTLFYVVDSDAPDDDQPAIQATFYNRDSAIKACDSANEHDRDAPEVSS